MDPREQYIDHEETLRVAWESFRAGLWTALPGIIQSFDATKLTAVVQPAIQGIQLQPDNNGQNPPATQPFLNLPLIPDVPVVFPRGGGCTLTFPIYPGGGDECLLVFSARCIDSWWQTGGVQPPFELRFHNLSDAFALVGPFSQAQKISNVSTSRVQLRSDDGNAYVELDPAGHVVSIVAPGGVNITAPTVAITGAVTVSQTITAQHEITAGAASTPINVTTHKHSGVQSGGSLTGLPQ